ncbi:MAG: ABC transporter ATP-binding protein [Bryobacteraceae bacterium]|nr:ABC transporter ATP-binding protein [Bryobacteraceae bacterium]
MITETPVAIRTSQLGKRYQSGQNTVVVFQNLSLDVREGERLALTGESGAGKSTLLHLLGGLDRPTEGTIQFGGTEITTLNEAGLADFRNRHVGFVWQTHYLLPEFTALENVMMPLLIRSVPRQEAAKQAADRLEEVGLGRRATHRAGELSGGEQQRVVIARALVGRPRVLLADEPTGNLDSRTGERIADVFEEIHRVHRLTSVFVTHNIGFAKRCDRILHLDNGTLLPRNEVFGPPASLQRGNGPRDTARKDGTDHV